MIELTVNGEVHRVPDADQERAMIRFWSAKSGGDPTARIRTLHRDDDPGSEGGNGGAPATAMPPLAIRSGSRGNGQGAGAALPAARTGAESPTSASTARMSTALAPVAGASTSASGASAGSTAASQPGAVSEVALERITLQEQWLSEAGFAVPPPPYAPGTRVTALGEQNFRLERQRVEHMPAFPDAAALLRQAIAGENRLDFTVPLADLAMDADGRLHVRGAEPVVLESLAFVQFATLAGFGIGARYLRDRCGPELRALNVNRQLHQAKDRRLTLRSRRQAAGAGDRQAFATVTPSYAPADSHLVLEAVAEHLQDAHTELLYDGTGVQATALWMPDTVVDLAAGDIFKAGVRIETDDTGRGRIRITGVVFRNRCLNLVIIGEGEVETVSLVHRGDADRILGIVRDGVTAARERIGSFLEAWGHARTVHVNPMATFKGWVEKKDVHVPGLRDEHVLLEHLLAAWSKEPGETLADCVNAVSRAAHETPIWGYGLQEQLERQAGRLVYVGAKGNLARGPT